MSDSQQPDPNQPNEQQLTFEQAVEQLEQIIDAIESGEVGLEQSLKQYEQGVKLLNHCRSILDRAEQKIEQLNVTDEASLEDAEQQDAEE